VRVSEVAVRNFRNWERAEVELAPGLTVVRGPVGAGKTSLLEAIYFGCVGRSCKTSNDREMVRFGADAARVVITTANGSVQHRLEAAVEVGRGKAFKVDGARRERLADAAERPLVSVFMPDRLELVKGAAGTRRAHLDALVTALWPTRQSTRAAYGRALVQRNSLVARARSGAAPASALAGWDRELARHAVALIADRTAALELASRTFAERAAQLGLPGSAEIAYKPRSSATTTEQFESELSAALENDLQRGFTTHGPHRDELSLRVAGRELRRYGSQGQQRLGLLALLLAERDALERERGSTPVLLLDDVLSELDVERRGRLVELLLDGGQALITTADPAAADIEAATPLVVNEGAIDA